MKDYSKYIPNSFGFITKLEIVGDEVHVWTPESKRGEPHKYSLEEFARLQKRLEKQYKLIIENKESLKKDYMKKLNKVLLTVGGSIVAIMIVAALAISAKYNIPIYALLSAPVTVAAASIITRIQKGNNFDTEMQTYETYLKERKSLEALSKEDKNITNSLNRQTTSRIQTNEELQEQGIIQDVFNIDFMDKTSLKQLQEMLTKYQISKSLQERQVFVNPNEIEPQEEKEEKTKRLKRDPRR